MTGKILFVLGLLIVVAAWLVQTDKLPSGGGGTTPKPEWATFRHSYITGFEGDFVSVNLSLQFPTERFVVAAEPGRDSRIVLVEPATDQQHTIEIFNNVAAGFADAREFWRERGFCSACREKMSPLRLPGLDTEKVVAYDDEEAEWLVAETEPGFVTIKLEKPSARARGVLETLTLEVEKSAPPPEFDAEPPLAPLTVSVFFLDQNRFDLGGEPYEVAVERLVSRSADPRQATLDELFRGPTAAEETRGWRLVRSGATGARLQFDAAAGTARVYLEGGFDSGGAAYTVANLIIKNLKQFPEVKRVRIYPPSGEALDPESFLGDSVPGCLQP